MSLAAQESVRDRVSKKQAIKSISLLLLGQVAIIIKEKNIQHDEALFYIP